MDFRRQKPMTKGETNKLTDMLKDPRLENHPLISKEKLTKEVQMLEDKLSGVPSPIVFTHNDLLLANIVIDGDKVSFIDYEYGDYNYQVYLSCHCWKSSFFVQKINFDFPRKLSIFWGWKTRENVGGLGFLAVDIFDFTRKIVKKKLCEKLVKMFDFCQNLIFGQKFDFSNSVI